MYAVISTAYVNVVASPVIFKAVNADDGGVPALTAE